MHISEVRQYLDGFENLFLIGRNGMHRYNNQDHSMLTAMTAVDNILSGQRDKSNIWAVNSEEEYPRERPKIRQLTLPEIDWSGCESRGSRRCQRGTFVRAKMN